MLPHMLVSLGFASNEIVASKVIEGRLVVPAVIDDEAAGVIVATNRTSPLTLHRSYVDDRGWQPADRVLMPSEAVGYGPTPAWFVHLSDFSTLGQQEQFLRAVVTASNRYRVASPTTPRTVGAVGLPWFRDRTIALDYTTGQVAVTAPGATPWHLRSRTLQPRFQFAMAGRRGAWLPVISGITANGRPLAFYLDTSVYVGGIALESYRTTFPLQGIWKRPLSAILRRRFTSHKRVATVLSMPGGRLERFLMYLSAPLRPLAESLQLAHLDGWLGLEFLERWVAILDFEIGMISLFDRPIG
jgi:hypothetical protein